MGPDTTKFQKGMKMSAHHDPTTRGTADIDEEGVHVEVQPAPGHTVVVISGDLDIETLLPAKEALERAFWDNQVVIADLERVTFCDSSGLNLLLRVRANAIAAGAQLRLAAVSEPVRRLLEITGTDAVFDARPTVRAALPDAS
ncbi:STAS domain-containing protein [Kitasatospora sp. NPDC002040]|uniref:STAS domain-containing protein n=1 Tax=Kitasatospora sp. NPDC002040 TaxID=3154661 RepID=UPI00331A5B95